VTVQNIYLAAKEFAANHSVQNNYQVIHVRCFS